MSPIKGIFACILLGLMRLFPVLFKIFIKDITGYYESRRISWLTTELKRESKQSIDELTHKHSAHWDYIKPLLPWQIHRHLSRFRGKERALTWRIKLLAFFAGFGPQVAEWILEEYMITAKVDNKPAADQWTCPKCGTHNQETALFCKDCGEYK